MRNIGEWTSQRIVVGNTILDKSTGEITMIPKKKYIFWGKRHDTVVFFSKVESISIEYHEPRGGYFGPYYSPPSNSFWVV